MGMVVRFSIDRFISFKTLLDLLLVVDGVRQRQCQAVSIVYSVYSSEKSPVRCFIVLLNADALC